MFIWAISCSSPKQQSHICVTQVNASGWVGYMRKGIICARRWIGRVAGHTQSGLELASLLGRYWHLRSEYNEGRYWLQRVQQLPDAADYPDEYAWVLYFEGVMATFQSDTETIRRSLTRSLEVAKACANRRCTAYALDFLGRCEAIDANFELAEALLDEVPIHLQRDRGSLGSRVQPVARRIALRMHVMMTREPWPSGSSR